MRNVWIQHCNISINPICCISLEELRGLARNQLCCGNVGWWPASCAVGGKKTPKERERRREDEVEEEIQRADVAAMVTSVTHGGANATVTNSFMFNRRFSVSQRQKSCSDGGIFFCVWGQSERRPAAGHLCLIDTPAPGQRLALPTPSSDPRGTRFHANVPSAQLEKKFRA